MAEDLIANFKNYQLQLQQVEAALATDSDNEDLLKLKKDLQEVIDLTKDVIKTQSGVEVAVEGSGDTSTAEGSSTTPASGSSESKASSSSRILGHNWTVGDKCEAMWSEDGGFYPAVIDVILEDGTCTVKFEGFDDTEVSQVHLLKPAEGARKRGADGEPDEGASIPKTKKDKAAEQREYKRKKSQKKAQKRMELEQAKEKEKNDWLSFNAKTFSKTHKGRVKKSIFASPDSVEGKVGVGTCGKSGNPMTAYHQNEKWKKQLTS